MRATWMGKPERVRLRGEAESSGATWTGSPKGVFAARKHHKPRLSLKNNMAGLREREEGNRTRVAGNRDEVVGVVANMLKLPRQGAAGFIDWLDGSRNHHARLLRTIICLQARI